MALWSTLPNDPTVSETKLMSNWHPILQLKMGTDYGQNEQPICPS